MKDGCIVERMVENDEDKIVWVLRKQNQVIVLYKVSDHLEIIQPTHQSPVHQQM